MITMKHFSQGALMLLLVFTLFTRCKKDDSIGSKGNVQFEITDGPADDAAIKGAFVTIAQVKVDGKEISGFTGRQTIDLMAYQNGNTKALGLAELDARTYNDLTLVLDFEKDAAGNSPGCYVLTTGNVKHNLQASSETMSEIKVNTGSFKVEESATAIVVLDFDVRKAIHYENTPSVNDQYDFVTKDELRTSLRMAVKSKTGKVQGTCNDNLGLTNHIVVYAYKKGTFNKNTEITGQGESQIEFKNAVTSTAVDAQGNYTLSFLEEGDYELHFFGYEDSNSDGKMEMLGELELAIAGGLGIDLSSISITANSSVSVSVLVTGLLP